MERPDPAADGIDIERPSAARLIDYAMGGSHNFAVDRELFGQLHAAMPNTGQIIHAAYRFGRRAVRFCVDAGIDQFLDVGRSGSPVRERVHKIAPDARVMYVDTDPVALALSRADLAGNDRAGVIKEDMRRPERILTHPDVTGRLDFDRPMAILLGGVLSLVPDEDDPAGIVARLRDAVAPGSYVVITHLTAERMPEGMSKSLHLMEDGGISPIVRTRAEVMRMFAGFELVEPGLVWTSQWRPNSPDDVGQHAVLSVILGGVGRKP
jgi:hypothetical protein